MGLYMISIFSVCIWVFWLLWGGPPGGGGLGGKTLGAAGGSVELGGAEGA